MGPIRRDHTCRFFGWHQTKGAPHDPSPWPGERSLGAFGALGDLSGIGYRSYVGDQRESRPWAPGEQPGLTFRA
jgi:hypothetical protein